MECSRLSIYFNFLLLIAAADCFLLRQPLPSQHNHACSSYVHFGGIKAALMPRRPIAYRLPSLCCSHGYTEPRPNIFLVGEPSPLKLDLGRSLASRLNYSFFDLDKLKLDSDSSDHVVQTVRHLPNEPDPPFCKLAQTNLLFWAHR